MARTSTQTQLQRLKRLEGILRSGQLQTAHEYAQELGVSLRTINRDLALLRDEGLVVEGERGRGGGIRLSASAGRAFTLSQDEAIDLLLSLAIAEKTGSPLLLKRLRSIRHKATLAFPPAHADRIRLLRQRILIGSPASEQLVADYSLINAENAEHVSRAFFEMRRLRIIYRDTMRRITMREIEPQFLHLNLPAWYLLAWDHLRGDVRCFRLDRIRSAEVLNAGFRLRDPRPCLGATEEGMDAL
jgi:predicted DNA-binding transcriptional regulator YafY